MLKHAAVAALALATTQVFAIEPANDAKIPPALYDLELDPAEQKNLAKDHPEIVERLKKLIAAKRQELGDRRLGITGTGIRPIGRLDYDPHAGQPAASAN